MDEDDYDPRDDPDFREDDYYGDTEEYQHTEDVFEEEEEDDYGDLDPGTAAHYRHEARRMTENNSFRVYNSYGNKLLAVCTSASQLAAAINGMSFMGRLTSHIYVDCKALNAMVQFKPGTTVQTVVNRCTSL